MRCKRRTSKSRRRRREKESRQVEVPVFDITMTL
jgi:hypothetical protein